MDTEKLSPTHVHHVNLLVQDLQIAKQQYLALFVSGGGRAAELVAYALP